MYPILTRTDYGFLYNFTAVWAVCALASLYFLKRKHPQANLFDWHIAILFGAILGGRFQFLLLNTNYFTENSEEVWQVYSGGLAYHGALWGGLCATAVYSLYKKGNWFTQLSLYTLWLPIWHMGGWLACWAEGCGYGRPAFIGWATAELPDSFGVIAVRYQTQLWGILASLTIAILLWRWQKRKDILSTQSFWITLALLQITQAIISFWRGDAMLQWHDFRLDSWLSLVTLLISLIMIVPASKAPPHPTGIP